MKPNKNSFVGTAADSSTPDEVTTSSQSIAKPNVIRRFSTALVWYHRSEEMPHEGNRIIVYSPCYDDKDPMKLRIIDSQFYGISKDAEWWAYVVCPNGV